MAKKTQCAIYCRVSTEDQTEGYSLDTQLAACRKYAEQQGWKIAAEFVEDYSGVTANRPELNKLRALLLSPDKPDVILCYASDRLARNLGVMLALRDGWRKVGVSLAFVMGISGEGPEQVLAQNLEGAIADYERTKIIERMMRGKRGKAQSGRVVMAATPPFGYDFKGTKRDKVLVIESSEAKVVRWIFDEARAGHTIGGIAKRLTQRKVPTKFDKATSEGLRGLKRQGVGVWTNAGVSQMLRNETYSGVWHYGKTHEVPDPQDGDGHKRLTVRSDKKEWIAVTVPAIVSPEVFAEVQAKLAGNVGNVGRPPIETYLLRSRVRCGVCKRAMAGAFTSRNGGTRTRYYRCTVRGEKPHLPPFNADKVERAVGGWLIGLLKEPKRVEEYIASISKQDSTVGDEARARLAEVETALLAEQKTLERVASDFLADIVSEEKLSQLKVRSQDAISKLEAERFELARQVEAIGRKFNPKTWRDAWAATLADWQQVLDDKKLAAYWKVIDNPKVSDTDKAQMVAWWDDQAEALRGTLPILFERFDVRLTLSVKDGAKIVSVASRLGAGEVVVYQEIARRP